MWPTFVTIEPGRRRWFFGGSRPRSCPPNEAARRHSQRSSQSQSDAEPVDTDNIANSEAHSDEVGAHVNTSPSTSSMLHLSMLMAVPTMVPRRRSEDELARIGTTWTLGEGIKEQADDDEDVSGDVREIVQSMEENVSKHNICGICLDPFEAGCQLTSLPCAKESCPSVWHTHCIREWLSNGNAAGCPLCRSRVDDGSSSPSSTEDAPAMSMRVWAVVPLLGGSRSSGRIPSEAVQDLLLLAFASMDDTPSEVLPPVLEDRSDGRISSQNMPFALEDQNNGNINLQSIPILPPIHRRSQRSMVARFSEAERMWTRNVVTLPTTTLAPADPYEEPSSPPPLVRVDPSEEPSSPPPLVLTTLHNNEDIDHGSSSSEQTP